MKIRRCQEHGYPTWPGEICPKCQIAILREALIEILYADHAMYCDEDDVYHICDKCDAMQITAYEALQKAGGEE